MTLNIRSAEVAALARELATIKGTTITAAVAEALRRELKQSKRPLRDRLRSIQAEIATFPPTGLKADKAFFDELSGEA